MTTGKLKVDSETKGPATNVESSGRIALNRHNLDFHMLKHKKHLNVVLQWAKYVNTSRV